jgi:hypothetical protein
MTMFAGSDVNFKRTAAKAIAAALHRWARSLTEVGLESGRFSLVGSKAWQIGLSFAWTRGGRRMT